MTEKTLKQSQSDMLYTLRAEFRLEKSVETALYNFLVDDEGEVLSNQEFLEVLRAFDNWVVNKEHQPTFAVGEYYADDHGHIVRIDKITIGHIAASKLCDGQITQTAFTFWLAQDVLKPATAEQTKEFKLAEAIAKTGQSADQIRQMLSNGKMPMGPWLELQKTAEELQEVADNE